MEGGTTKVGGVSAVLVTGGAGYIGRYVCEALAKSGFQPVAFDNLAIGDGASVIHGPLHRSDVLDADELQLALAIHHPVGVIHLAAWCDVEESMRDPAKYRENVAGTANVAEVFAGLPIVFSSSAAVYGQPDACTVNEDAPTVPVNPYGASKLDCEAALKGAACLRFFNVAGGHGDRGGHLIPWALEAIASGKRFRLNGDGSAVRDFVHIEDVARACVVALRAMLEGWKPAAPLNVCSGEGYAVREVLTACERITGRWLPIEDRPPRNGDPSRLVGDPSRASMVLGWRSSHKLDAIIRSAMNEGELLGSR
jgi:UDP-arabinose 4-epimerase